MQLNQSLQQLAEQALCYGDTKGIGEGVYPANNFQDSRPQTSEQSVMTAELLGSSQVEKDEQTIQPLAKLDEISYDRERKESASKLGIKVSTLDNQVRSIRDDGSRSQRRNAIRFEEPSLLDEAINGMSLITKVKDYVSRYLVLPPGCADVIALWVVNTYAHQHARVSPILAITSPDKRCGKSTVISVIKRLCYKPMLASNISPAALFRTTEKYQPTLLIDEADTFIKDNDELRGIINSGHMRDTAYVIRLTGENFESTSFSTWAPKAIALIGSLPPTIQDRSIEVCMRRKLVKEYVQKLPIDEVEDTYYLRQMLMTWACKNASSLRSKKEYLLPGLHDRAQDNWLPLLTIAECIDSGYFEEVSEIATRLSMILDDDSAGSMLLSDLVKIFGDKDRMFTRDILTCLNNMEDRPWSEWRRGSEMSSRSLAKLLKPYRIIPGTVRIGKENLKGFKLESLKDAVSRYVSPRNAVTTSQVNDANGSSNILSVTPNSSVTDRKSRKANVFNGCDGVTDSKGDIPGKGEKIDNEDIWDEQ